MTISHNFMRLAAISLSLAGCATDATKPEVVTKVEQLPPIRIPVPIRCVSLTEIPEIPETYMRPGSDLWQNEQELRADLDAFKIYALKADPLLKGCATESQPQTEVKK